MKQNVICQSHSRPCPKNAFCLSLSQFYSASLAFKTQRKISQLNLNSQNCCPFRFENSHLRRRQCFAAVWAISPHLKLDFWPQNSLSKSTLSTISKNLTNHISISVPQNTSGMPWNILQSSKVSSIWHLRYRKVLPTLESFRRVAILAFSVRAVSAVPREVIYLTFLAPKCLRGSCLQFKDCQRLFKNRQCVLEETWYQWDGIILELVGSSENVL